MEEIYPEDLRHGTKGLSEGEGKSHAYVLMTAVGLAAINERNVLINFKPFAEDPSKIAEIVKGIQAGEIPQTYVEEFLQTLVQKGIDKLFYWDSRVGRLLQTNLGKFNLQTMLVEARPLDIEAVLPYTELERYRALVKAVAEELARQRIVAEAGRRDLHIVHAVRVFDDLEKMRNQVYVRVREWYNLHFPELAGLVEDIETYLKLVSLPFIRGKTSEAEVSKLLKPDVLKRVFEAAERSVGAAIGPLDMERIALYSTLGREISRLAEKINEYINELMSAEAPNLMAVAGPILGSRLISLAGGLEKLARLPASTIQVLGAEKALFRFFRTGRGAPKHGIIFQHPLVHGSARWQRGKIARVLAAKISIAAKIDYFSKEDRGSQLRSLLEQRVEEIKKKYPKPQKKESGRQERRKRVHR